MDTLTGLLHIPILGAIPGMEPIAMSRSTYLWDYFGSAST